MEVDSDIFRNTAVDRGTSEGVRLKDARRLLGALKWHPIQPLLLFIPGKPGVDPTRRKVELEAKERAEGIDV